MADDPGRLASRSLLSFSRLCMAMFWVRLRECSRLRWIGQLRASNDQFGCDNYLTYSLMATSVVRRYGMAQLVQKTWPFYIDIHTLIRWWPLTSNQSLNLPAVRTSMACIHTAELFLKFSTYVNHSSSSPYFFTLKWAGQTSEAFIHVFPFLFRNKAKWQIL